MAKKKSKQTIKGIAQVPENNLTVVKTNPLESLLKSSITLEEFKIMDAYLARINSFNPNDRKVVFRKDELEEVFGLSKINLSTLKKRMKNLMSSVVEIQDSDYKRGYTMVTLFEKAVVDADDDGVQTISMECTQSAMKYFFNCEKIGYYRYKLKAVKTMRSRYAYALFNYFERRRNMGLVWEVPLDELKQLLKCDDTDTYDEYKFFNQKILKRCQQEIHEKTECRFEYEPIRSGRKVTKIKFTLSPLSERIVEGALPQEPADPNQVSLYDTPELQHYLTPEEITALTAQLRQKVPEFDQDAAQDQLNQMLLDMLATESRTNKAIKHKRNYLSAMIDRNKIVPAATNEPAGEYVPGELELASIRNLQKLRDSLASDNEEVQP